MNPQLVGGRNNRRDVDDDYYPGKGYTFEAILFKSVIALADSGCPPYIKARLTYLRPRWNLLVSVDGLILSSCSGDARTLRTAKDEAMDIILGFHVPHLLRQYYQERHATLILRDGKPFVSLFGKFPDYRSLPIGSYTTDDLKIERWSTGYSTVRYDG